jgi:hypothetical protein
MNGAKVAGLGPDLKRASPLDAKELANQHSVRRDCQPSEHFTSKDLSLLLQEVTNPTAQFLISWTPGARSVDAAATRRGYNF